MLIGIAGNNISVNHVQAVPCGDEIFPGVPRDCNALPLDWVRRCLGCPGPLTILDLLRFNPDQKPVCCDGIPPVNHTQFINVNVTHGPASDAILIVIPKVTSAMSLQNTSAMVQ